MEAEACIFALLIMLPFTLYVFSVNELGPAIIFAVWTLLWSVSDNVLNPLLLGKGVDIPMLAILIGAIGAMLMEDQAPLLPLPSKDVAF